LRRAPGNNDSAGIAAHDLFNEPPAFIITLVRYRTGIYQVYIGRRKFRDPDVPVTFKLGKDGLTVELVGPAAKCVNSNGGFLFHTG
jgi:hypothetical protein